MRLHNSVKLSLCSPELDFSTWRSGLDLNITFLMKCALGIIRCKSMKTAKHVLVCPMMKIFLSLNSSHFVDDVQVSNK